jgi:hypothetical protein
MQCISPLTANRLKRPNKNGKYPLEVQKSGVENFNPHIHSQQIEIACGRCIPCRLKKSYEWAVRAVHEAKMHDHNCFITLTYSDDNLPRDRSLDYEHFRLFIKRLRRKVKPAKISFLMSGEYGDEFTRPHYHACIFGYDFPDKYYWANRNGNDSYRSEILENTWKFGHAEIGELNFATAAYVASYTVKKVGEYDEQKFQEHYSWFDPSTGEYFLRRPEFGRMSLRPAIGKRFYDAYGDDFHKGYTTEGGRKRAIPEYYKRLAEKDLKDYVFELRQESEEKAKEQDRETSTRLKALETLCDIRTKRKQRGNLND